MTSNQESQNPPNGYKEPISYQSSPWVRGAWVVGLFTISLFIYTPTIRYTLLTDPIAVLDMILVNSLEIIIVGGAISILNVIPHEYFHNIVARSLGYPAVIKWNARLNHREPFNFIPDFWIDTREYNIILLSPLVLINSIAASLVIMEISPLVNYIATAVLLINTATSSDDVRMVLTDSLKSDSAKIKQQIEDGSLVAYRSSKVEN